MKITIKELAKMANVSVATVSRVMNHHPQGVSKEKREEILALAEKYHYTPNLIAKSMVTHKSQCIGLLVPDILNPFFQYLFRGLEDYVMPYGYSVFLCNTDNDPMKYLNCVKAMLGKSVDGFILTGYPLEIADELDILLKHSKVISIDRYIEQCHFTQIITDSFKSAYEMTNYLIRKGHKKIACLTGPKELYVTEERIRGYRTALEEHGISYSDNLIVEGDFELQSGLKFGRQLVIESGATAIFCFNDLMAQGVYQACREMNKQIPEDISIVGFDDIYIAELMAPSLTTIRQPKYEVGQLAGQLLMTWISENKPPITPRPLDNRLIIRESVKTLIKD